MRSARTIGIGAVTALALAIALGQAAAQQSAVGETRANQQTGPVTLSGCIMRESDYRREHNLGGGAMGGVGLGDAYVIVDSSRSGETPRTGACAGSGTGPAYRITGYREEELKAHVGRRVEVSGTFDPDRDGESKLPQEVAMTSFREATATASTTTQSSVDTRADAASRAPAPMEAGGDLPASQARMDAPPAGESAAELPRTASPIPLIGLIGLLSLAAGSALWLKRK